MQIRWPTDKHVNGAVPFEILRGMEGKPKIKLCEKGSPTKFICRERLATVFSSTPQDLKKDSPYEMMYGVVVTRHHLKVTLSSHSGSMHSIHLIHSIHLLHMIHTFDTVDMLVRHSMSQESHSTDTQQSLVVTRRSLNGHSTFDGIGGVPPSTCLKQKTYFGMTMTLDLRGLLTCGSFIIDGKIIFGLWVIYGKKFN